MKYLKQLVAAIFILAFTSGCSFSDDYPDNLPELVKFYKNNDIEKMGSPMSGAFLVMKGDSVILKKVVGYTTDKGKTRISTNSKFYIGSVSKQFTAVLCLKLVDEGKLDLHKPISVYLPELSENLGSKITVHHLLSNTSGLPHYPALLGIGIKSQKDLFTKEITPKDWIRYVSQLSLISSPGEEFHYSSLGYMLAGAVIESITNDSYSLALNRMITKPLGMTNTGYLPYEIPEGLVNDYIYKKGVLNEVYDRNMSTAFSAGGVHSTIDDMEIWIRAIKNSSILSESSQKLWFTPVKQGYSYGWHDNPESFIKKDMNSPLFWHGGATMRYRSSIALYKDDISIVFLRNILPQGSVDRINTQFHLAALGKNEAVKDFIHPSLRNLPHFEEEGGLKALKYYYKEISRRAGYEIFPSNRTMREIVEMYLEEKKYGEITPVVDSLLAKEYLPEDLLNTIGYEYLNFKYFDKAISIGKENVRRHPDTPNVYDSLGEFYETKGDTAEAKKNYQRAVELGLKQRNRNLKTFQKNLDRVSK
ncbi:MAG: serine hydrolase [Flavobacteriaceae bacterium]|nr:serine hydrolase [Flavobacteriaceae bacterium]